MVTGDRSVWWTPSHARQHASLWSMGSDILHFSHSHFVKKKKITNFHSTSTPQSIWIALDQTLAHVNNPLQCQWMGLFSSIFLNHFFLSLFYVKRLSVGDNMNIPNVLKWIQLSCPMNVHDTATKKKKNEHPTRSGIRLNCVITFPFVNVT